MELIDQVCTFPQYIYEYKKVSYATFTAHKLIHYIISTQNVQDNLNVGSWIYINKANIHDVYNFWPSNARNIIIRINKTIRICYDIRDTLGFRSFTYECDYEELIFILSKIIYYNPFVIMENIQRNNWLPENYGYKQVHKVIQAPSMLTNIKKVLFDSNSVKYWNQCIDEYHQLYL